MEITKTKILVVEDDTAIAKIMVDRLIAEGFQVTHCTNGRDGLQQALQIKPDLLLVDIMMPILDGLEMIKQLRQDTWGQGANVIILTNLTRDEKLEEAFEYGVTDYLVKANWDIEDVVEKIKDKVSTLI